MRLLLPLMLAGSVIVAGCAPKVVTRSEMRRLHPGMTYAEVVEVVGAPGRLRQPGERVVGALVPQPGQEVHVWTNADGSLVSAAFDGGRLVSSSEYGF